MEYPFTEEQIRIAKQVDLIELIKKYGFTPVRVGSCYSAKEMDSLRIYSTNTWYRNSDGTGGSTIDFVCHFSGVGFTEAVSILLGQDYRKVDYGQMERRPEKKKFVLPKPYKNNNRLYGYLIKGRKLSKEIVDYFVKNGLAYEENEYHNVVFCGKDAQGNVKYAAKRSTNSNSNFKGDVAGNDKRYGINIVNKDSDILIVTEAVIDLMSYMDMYKDFESNKLAICMLADNSVKMFLRTNPHIKRIAFAFDNDQPGREAAEKYKLEYEKKGYETKIFLPKGKDWNEVLKQKRAWTEKKTR